MATAYISLRRRKCFFFCLFARFAILTGCDDWPVQFSDDQTTKCFPTSRCAHDSGSVSIRSMVKGACSGGGQRGISLFLDVFNWPWQIPMVKKGRHLVVSVHQLPCVVSLTFDAHAWFNTCCSRVARTREEKTSGRNVGKLSIWS